MARGLGGSALSSARVSDADQILAEIRRLYRQLDDLPQAVKPTSTQHAGLAYTALEARIRWYAERYKVLTEETTHDDQEARPRELQYGRSPSYRGVGLTTDSHSRGSDHCA